MPSLKTLLYATQKHGRKSAGVGDIIVIGARGRRKNPSKIPRGGRKQEKNYKFKKVAVYTVASIHLTKIITPDAIIAEMGDISVLKTLIRVKLILKKIEEKRHLNQRKNTQSIK